MSKIKTYTPYAPYTPIPPIPLYPLYNYNPYSALLFLGHMPTPQFVASHPRRTALWLETMDSQHNRRVEVERLYYDGLTVTAMATKLRGHRRTILCLRPNRFGKNPMASRQLHLSALVNKRRHTRTPGQAETKDANRRHGGERRLAGRRSTT